MTTEAKDKTDTQSDNALMKKPVMNPLWDQFNPHDHSREEYDAAMKQYNEYLKSRDYLESLGINTDEEEKAGLQIMKMIHKKAQDKQS